MSLLTRNYDPATMLGAKIGHFTVGAVVTQATNRTTGVTINSLSGQITTNNASLAAETGAVFTVTDNTVVADDVVLVAIAGGSNGGNTTATVTTISAGSFQITVANQNASGGTAETGAILINFIVMKAAQS